MAKQKVFYDREQNVLLLDDGRRDTRVVHAGQRAQPPSATRNGGSGRTTRVKAGETTEDDQTAYPASWRAAVRGSHGHKVRGQSRVTHARD